MAACAAQCALNGISASSGLGCSTACAIVEGPAGCAVFQTAVLQQILSGLPDRAGTHCAVVCFVRGAAAGIGCVGRSQNVARIVSGVGVDRTPCIVKQEMGQHIIAVSGGPVCAVVPVYRFAVIRVGNGNRRPRSGARGLLILRNLTVGISKGQAVTAFRIGHLCSPVAAVGIGGKIGAASFDTDQIGSAVGQGVHIPGGIRNTGQIVAAIGKGRNRNCGLALVLLGNT